MLKLTCFKICNVFVSRGVIFCIALAILICNPGGIQAVDLVVYPFNNNADGNNGLNYSSLDSTLLASSSVSQGSGLNVFQVGTDSWSGTTQVLKTGPGSDVPNANAITAFINYWYFTIRLVPNTAIDIDTISADWSRGGQSSTRGWFIRSNLDNYQADLYSNTTPAGTLPGLAPAAINLNGFTSISTPVSFRFYIFTDAQLRYMDFQNIKFTGKASVVPEPATWIYSILAMGIVLGSRFFQCNRQSNRLGKV